MTLKRYKVAVFVHGCFWHRHEACRYATNPRTNVHRWNAKFDSNIERDQKNILALEQLGWSVIIVWECELRSNAEHRLQELVGQIHAAKKYAD